MTAKFTGSQSVNMNIIEEPEITDRIVANIRFKIDILSGAQGKNSSAKWLHLTVFYVLFHSVDPKKHWSNGQQGKNLT